MSKRLLTTDTDADDAIRACIEATPPRPFVVRAGAGSGKTTSLIKALAGVLKVHGASLQRRKQQVACITYTDLAAQEVSADVEANPLVHVSTIHSFYWSIIKTFQADIKAWVIDNIQERIAKLQEDEAGFTKRTAAHTRANNQRDQQRYMEQREVVPARVTTFTYGMGSDYPKGVLGHDEILKIANFLLKERPLFRRLVGLRFPFLFVDESQDTMPDVVASFKLVEADMRGQFCLGFFGDPMQKIYLTGVGNIPPEDGWAKVIDKPENYRCARAILDVANAVRLPGDGLHQVRGAMKNVDGVLQPVQGSARLFVLPSTSDRGQALSQVREWTARQNQDEGWREEQAHSVKVLVIVHRMAANRLGFGGVYAALNDRAPDGLKQGFQDGTAWPLRPFMTFVLPIVTAMKQGDEFAAMNLLRQFCPRLTREGLTGQSAVAILSEVRAAVLRLVELMEPQVATVRDVLDHLRQSGLYNFDPRYARALDLVPEAPTQGAPAAAADAQGEQEDAEGSTRTDAVVQAFFKCTSAELWPYRRYVSAESAFATQHGVKGAEFERVLVVMDEEESEYNLYNYEKFFGIEPLSSNDEKKLQAGEDNVLARTRRLLYVCCTRAKRDLVLVLFAQNEALARDKVKESGILPVDCVLCGDALVM